MNMLGVRMDSSTTNFFGDTCDGGYGNVNINDLEERFVSNTSRPSK